jgi:hypothetical protein
MAEEMPICKLLIAAMIFWTTLWIDELTLAPCDYNCATVNKQADNCQRMYLKHAVDIHVARS